METKCMENKGIVLDIPFIYNVRKNDKPMYVFTQPLVGGKEPSIAFEDAIEIYYLQEILKQLKELTEILKQKDNPK